MIVRFSGLATPAICYLCGQEKLLLIVSSSFSRAEEKLCWGSLDRPSKWPGLSTPCISDPLVQRNDFVTSWARQRGEEVAVGNMSAKTSCLTSSTNLFILTALIMIVILMNIIIMMMMITRVGWKEIRQFTWELLRFIRQRGGGGNPGRHKVNWTNKSRLGWGYNRVK